MNPVLRKTVGNAALALVLVGLTGALVTAWKRYGSLNPYGGLDRGHKPNPMAEIQATGVQVRQYHDGKLVTKADAKSLTVAQGGGRIVLQGVRNGVAQTPQGPVQFAAKTGVLNPFTKVVEVSNGIRVKGADFDIASSMARINTVTGDVDVPHPLEGKIGGGDFSAASMMHRNGTDFTKIVLPKWKGKIQAPNAPPVIKDKVWRFTGDDVTNGTNDPIKAKDPVERRLRHAVEGWASDGEMVITAPALTQDPKTEIVTAVGNGKERATYHSVKADIVADKVVIYQKEHKAVCTGHVLVYVQPKSEWDKPLRINDDDRGPLVPDIPPALMAKMGAGATLSQADKDKISELRSGKNLRDYPMQMAAEEVTYWYQEGERHAIAKGGNPTAFQKFDDGRWRQAWAPEAHYDGEKDLLDLIGSLSKREVHMKNSVADNNDCFNATLSTKEDQTEEDQYVHMVRPKAAGKDFDADPATTPAAKPGAAPAGTPPAKGTPPPAGTPPTKTP